MATVEATKKKTHILPVVNKDLRRQRGPKNSYTRSGLLLDHKPTTGILDKIKEGSPDKKILTDVLITPDIAKDLLSINAGNRHLTNDVVKHYADMMREGKWHFIGNAIKVSNKNRVIDGQHELWAIIESGKPQLFHIQTGLHPDSFAVIDVGKKRTAGDAIDILGYQNANVVAAAIKQMIFFKKFQQTKATLHSGRVSNAEIMAWVKTENIKRMEDGAEHAVKFLHVKGPWLANSTWAFLSYLFSEKHRGDAMFFLTTLATGENLSPTKNSAIYFCREKLLTLRGRNLTELKIRYVMRAWNLYRERARPTELRINTKDKKIEKPI